ASIPSKRLRVVLFPQAAHLPKPSHPSHSCPSWSWQIYGNPDVFGGDQAASCPTGPLSRTAAESIRCMRHPSVSYRTASLNPISFDTPSSRPTCLPSAWSSSRTSLRGHENASRFRRPCQGTAAATCKWLVGFRCPSFRTKRYVGGLLQ